MISYRLFILHRQAKADLLNRAKLSVPSTPSKMAVDLVSRLNTTVAQAEHDILKALVLSSDLPERDRDFTYVDQ